MQLPHTTNITTTVKQTNMYWYIAVTKS
jgi:hypothetical protein